MRLLRIAILGTSHIHLPDHVAALAGPGLSQVGSPQHADALILGGSPTERETLLGALAEPPVPVLAEKPLARTARATAALLQQRQGPVTTAMFLRCSPVFGALRRLVVTGELGEITSVHAEFSHPGWWDGAFAGRAAWMGDQRAAPGGALTDLGIHLLDVLVWMQPSWALRLSEVVRTRPHDGGPVVAGSALLRWGQVPVTLHAGWTSRPGALRMSVSGSQGRAEAAGGVLTLDRGSGPRPVHSGPAPAAADAVHAFVRQIRGGRAVLPPPADILRCAVLMDDLAAADG